VPVPRRRARPSRRLRRVLRLGRSHPLRRGARGAPARGGRAGLLLCLEAWEEVQRRGYEGLVAKDDSSTYSGGTRLWLKVKRWNPW